MIVVHHLEQSRSHRVLWLLELLELPYELRRYPRDPKTSLAPPELLAVHPLGKSPVITDGEVAVAESGAILTYLLETYGEGRLAPEAGTEEHRRFTYWMHYAEGSLMPYLVLTLVMRRIGRAPAPFFLRPILRGVEGKVMRAFVRPNLDRHVAFLEHELGRTTWFAGDRLTAADVQMSYPVHALLARGGDRPMPRLRAYLERVHADPAWQRAVARGGPMEIPWR